MSCFHAMPPGAIFFGARVLPLLAALLLPACAVDISVPGFQNDPVTTGAVTSPAKILSPHLTDDDWAKARPALKAAFDPANGGRPVVWSNAATGFGGSFMALALEPGRDVTCGTVRFDLTGVPEPRPRTGRACLALSGEWVMKGADAGVVKDETEG